MSGKALKRIRRELRPIYRREEARARAAIKCPRWRVVLAGAGFPGFMRRWIARETPKVEAALATARKRTARVMRDANIEHERALGEAQVKHAMRAGPQPMRGQVIQTLEDGRSERRRIVQEITGKQEASSD